MSASRPEGAGAVMAGRAPAAVEGDEALTALHRQLDYFPTPPWAARAGAELIRFVDPEARTIWEPACGDGHMAAVLRPADTAYVSDGLTIINKPRTSFVITFGCEAAQMHQGGGNFIFLDGHAKRITGNIERYLKQRADGKWFETYMTYSME